ncbi:MAG: HAD family hydrolase [Kibdelosporangium sp.]
MGRQVKAVLFDRDGTLVKDVPYNGDPHRVEPVPTAARALKLLRANEICTGVITNQSGVARKLITAEQVNQVNARIEQLLGAFDTWQICPHDHDDGCGCRKPEPGMVFTACTALNLDPDDVIVIGDVESDMTAARNAGSRSVLVPTTATRIEEIERAKVTAADLKAAVDWALS